MTAVYFAVAKLEGTEVRGLGGLQTPSNVPSCHDLVLVCNIVTLSRHRGSARNPRCSDEPVREALQRWPHTYRSSSRGRAPQGGRGQGSPSSDTPEIVHFLKSTCICRCWRWCWST